MNNLAFETGQKELDILAAAKEDIVVGKGDTVVALRDIAAVEEMESPNTFAFARDHRNSCPNKAIEEQGLSWFAQHNHGMAWFSRIHKRLQWHH